MQIAYTLFFFLVVVLVVQAQGNTDEKMYSRNVSVLLIHVCFRFGISDSDIIAEQGKGCIVLVHCGGGMNV